MLKKFSTVNPKITRFVIIYLFNLHSGFWATIFTNKNLNIDIFIYK